MPIDGNVVRISRETERARKDKYLAALQAGDEAAQALRDALARISVKFPSLKGDTPADGRPMVAFGGAAAQVAVDLADAINTLVDLRDAQQPKEADSA